MKNISYIFAEKFFVFGGCLLARTVNDVLQKSQLKRKDEKLLPHGRIHVAYKLNVSGR